MVIDQADFMTTNYEDSYLFEYGFLYVPNAC